MLEVKEISTLSVMINTDIKQVPKLNQVKINQLAKMHLIS